MGNLGTIGQGKQEGALRGLGRFSVRDLVIAAAMASVGGAMSAYVGYLGNLVNRVVGVPFGAGQVLAGLHVVWPLLAVGLTRRAGAGTLTGVVKGAVELLMGGTHGVVILLISAVQGFLVDLGLSLSPRTALWAYVVAGAGAAASNVLVFQALYFSGVPTSFIMFMTGLAALSGAVLGGWLAHDLLGALRRAGVARAPAVRPGHTRTWAALAVAVAVVSGGGYYYLGVWEPFSAVATVQIGGDVATTETFVYRAWDHAEVAVRAELTGAVTYEPERTYRGVPLRAVLEEAGLGAQAQEVAVRARDGYEVRFPLSEVMGDDRVLLVLEGDQLRLVAAGYPGSLWVRGVVAVEVR